MSRNAIYNMSRNAIYNPSGRDWPITGAVISKRMDMMAKEDEERRADNRAEAERRQQVQDANFAAYDAAHSRPTDRGPISGFGTSGNGDFRSYQEQADGSLKQWDNLAQQDEVAQNQAFSRRISGAGRAADQNLKQQQQLKNQALSTILEQSHNGGGFLPPTQLNELNASMGNQGVKIIGGNFTKNGDYLLYGEHGNGVRGPIMKLNQQQQLAALGSTPGIGGNLANAIYQNMRNQGLSDESIFAGTKWRPDGFNKNAARDEIAKGRLALDQQRENNRMTLEREKMANRAAGGSKGDAWSADRLDAAKADLDELRAIIANKDNAYDEDTVQFAKDAYPKALRRRFAYTFGEDGDEELAAAKTNAPTEEERAAAVQELERRKKLATSQQAARYNTNFSNGVLKASTYRPADDELMFHDGNHVQYLKKGDTVNLGGDTYKYLGGGNSQRNFVPVKGDEVPWGSEEQEAAGGQDTAPQKSTREVGAMPQQARQDSTDYADAEGANANKAEPVNSEAGMNPAPAAAPESVPAKTRANVPGMGRPKKQYDRETYALLKQRSGIGSSVRNNEISEEEHGAELKKIQGARDMTSGRSVKQVIMDVANNIAEQNGYTDYRNNPGMWTEDFYNRVIKATGKIYETAGREDFFHKNANKALAAMVVSDTPKMLADGAADFGGIAWRGAKNMMKWIGNKGKDLYEAVDTDVTPESEPSKRYEYQELLDPYKGKRSQFAYVVDDAMRDVSHDEISKDAMDAAENIRESERAGRRKMKMASGKDRVDAVNREAREIEEEAAGNYNDDAARVRASEPFDRAALNRNAETARQNYLRRIKTGTEMSAEEQRLVDDAASRLRAARAERALDEESGVLLEEEDLLREAEDRRASDEIVANEEERRRWEGRRVIDALRAKRVQDAEDQRRKDRELARESARVRDEAVRFAKRGGKRK